MIRIMIFLEESFETFNDLLKLLAKLLTNVLSVSMKENDFNKFFEIDQV